MVAMAAPRTQLPKPVYASEDHRTWAALMARQTKLLADCGCSCQAFTVGFEKLALDPHQLPDPAAYNARIQGMSNWSLGNAQNEYLGPTEWFEHIAARRFPVTDYIRRPHEIEFTPMPDLFHEYFGHLAFFTDRVYGDMAERFGHLYLSAVNDRQQLGIARLWWYTLEFGFIRENGDLKIYGAGLYSSPGELLHSLKPETPKLPFEIQRVAETPGAAYSMHTAYFILEDYDHPNRIMDDFARAEGLPVPPYRG